MIKYHLYIAIILVLAHIPGLALSGSRDKNISSENDKILKRVGTIMDPEIRESSGIVKSRKWPGVFWTHNDSGGRPRIFPMKVDGTPIRPLSRSTDSGIEVAGAGNKDWEDICADDKGNLIIGDIGDNYNVRRDLCVYIVPEPDPYSQGTVQSAAKINIFYPDRPEWGIWNRDFDSEAIFYARGHIFLFTKHRSNNLTKVYKLETLGLKKPNKLALICQYPIKGHVTAADASPDGSSLAALTYSRLWLFEFQGPSMDLNNCRAYSVVIDAGQCEGITFDGDQLIITNENRAIFKVSIQRVKAGGPYKAKPGK